MKRAFTFSLTLVFYLVLVGSATAARAGAANPAGVRLGYEPGKPVDTITVVLASETGAARIPLFLEYSGQQALQEALLFARVLDENGQPLSAGTVQFLDVSQANAVLGRMTLEPDSLARQVLLDFHDFSFFGNYTGFIAIETGGSSTRIAGLSVARSAEGALKIQEANENDEITLNAFGRQLDDRLFLLETSGQAESQEIQLGLSPLRDTTGRSATLALEPDTFEFKAYLSQPVRVVGSFPSVGDYRGLLTLTYGEHQKTYSLLIKSQLGQEQFEVDALSPSVLIHGLPGLAVDGRVRINLNETANSPATLYIPSLEKLLRSGPGEQNNEADFAGWELRNIQNQALSAEGQDGAANTISLDPNQSTQVILQVDDLRHAGQYEGTVLVKTPGGGLVRDTFQLYVKDGWLLPLIVIFLGTWASYGLRRWLETGRPQAVEEAGIARMRARIGETITDAQDRIRLALEERLEILQVENQIDSSVNITNELAGIQTMLANYQFVRAVLNLRPGLEALVADPAQRVKLVERLAGLEADLERRGLAGLQDGQAGEKPFRTTAEEIRADVMVQASAGLQKAFTTLETRLAEARTALEASSLPKEEQLPLAELLDSSQASLGRARSSLPAAVSPASVADWSALEKARREYNQAQTHLQAYHAAFFLASLDAQAKAMPGFTDAQWAEFKTEVARRLKAEGYDRTYRYYLRRLLEAMAREAHQNVDKYKELKEVEIAAQKAQELVEKDPEAAQKEYTRLVGEVEKILGQKGGALSGERQSISKVEAILNRLLPGRVDAALPAPSPNESPRELLRKIFARIRRNDTLAVLIIGLVSVLIGLRLLWVDNPTFGSLEDYISAFLWGFGLHELNKVVLPSAASRLGLTWFQTETPPKQEGG